MTITRSEVRVRPNSCQSCEAEMERVFTAPHKADGMPFTIDEAGHMLFRPARLAKNWEA